MSSPHAPASVATSSDDDQPGRLRQAPTTSAAQAPPRHGAAEEVRAAPQQAGERGRGGRPPAGRLRGATPPGHRPRRRASRRAGRQVGRTLRDMVRPRGMPTRSPEEFSGRSPRSAPPPRGPRSCSRRPRAAAARAARRRADRRRHRRRRTRTTELATGRLVLLHDPAGHEAWQGTFRVVTYVRAELEPEMASDPLLPGVGWAWLTEALDGHGAGFARRERHRHPGRVGELRGHRRRAGDRPDRDPRLVDPARRRVRRAPAGLVRPALHHRRAAPVAPGRRDAAGAARALSRR